MKSVFYFMLKALFLVKIFTFLSELVGYVEKRLDKKAKVDSKIYDVTECQTDNNNTYFAQQSDIGI